MKRINAIFNPKKITLKGNVKIVDTDSGKYVIKTKNQDIKSFYDYLNTRNFNNYPKIIDEYDDNYVYEYVDDIASPIEQKVVDMATTVAALHTKTVFFKEVSVDNLKEVYENIYSNINYLENYYNGEFSKIELEEYMSPSGYFLIRNRTRFVSLFKYLYSELEAWYKLVMDETKERVVYNHNNLTIDHFMEKDSKFLVSWDNYMVDSPILDIVNLYKNDFNKYDFSIFLTAYLKSFELLPAEKKLLFITLSIPEIVYITNSEMENTINYGKLVDYIDRTEKLIRPYYSVENPKE